MTNKEKLIAIIGDENFRKLERNFNREFGGHPTTESLAEYRGIQSLEYAFAWIDSPEGRSFWEDLNALVYKEWAFIHLLRKISQEEQELLFKMFVMEWMEYLQGNNEEWYEFCLGQGLGLKIYEALRSE